MQVIHQITHLTTELIGETGGNVNASCPASLGLNLKINKKGSFPSFDHKLKDPLDDSILIKGFIYFKDYHEYVIVEGLYLFLKEWDIH